MKNKKIFYTIFIFVLFIIILFSYSNYSYSADSKLVNTLKKAFEQIQDWMLKLATPIAAVAAAVGAFMQKFSFGDEERIRVGKKLIKSTLFSYVFVLAINLILSAIKSLI